MKLVQGRRVLLAVAVAAILAAVSWPRRAPETLRFVSPPVDSSGARLHIQLPSGWESVQSVNTTSSSAQGPDRTMFVFSNRPGGFLSGWFSGWRRKPVESQPVMVVEVVPADTQAGSPGPFETSPDGIVLVPKTQPAVEAQKEQDETGKVRRQVFSTSRVYFSPGGKYQITLQYFREGHPEPPETLDSIGRSVRIVKPED